MGWKPRFPPEKRKMRNKKVTQRDESLSGNLHIKITTLILLTPLSTGVSHRTRSTERTSMPPRVVDVGWGMTLLVTECLLWNGCQSVWDWHACVKLALNRQHWPWKSRTSGVKYSSSSEGRPRLDLCLGLRTVWEAQRVLVSLCSAGYAISLTSQVISSTGGNWWWDWLDSNTLDVCHWHVCPPFGVPGDCAFI